MDAAGHDPSVPDPRPALQRRAGRWPNRHWLYVEPQADGRWMIEVPWLPTGVILPEPGELTLDGGLRFYVAAAELPMSRLFAALGRAFLVANGEIDACVDDNKLSPETNR